jgi:hypothetical protein
MDAPQIYGRAAGNLPIETSRSSAFRPDIEGLGEIAVLIGIPGYRGDQHATPPVLDRQKQPGNLNHNWMKT